MSHKIGDVVLSFNEALEIHSAIDLDNPATKIEVANYILAKILGRNERCLNVETADIILQSLLRSQLEHDEYVIGATLCWGTNLFDSRPHSVQLICKGLQTKPQLLIFGAGAMGKSYTVIAIKLLDWDRDPEFTTIKMASTTAGHERANTFSNLVRLHKFSAIKLHGYIRQGFIGLDKDDRRSSISEVSIDKGDENKSGKLQGFHPLPRPYPHPRFGWQTRVCGVFDEVEDIALGLWKGESNMMLNMDDEMHVSIVAMWNPKDKQSMAAQKSEPHGGWFHLDESQDEYVSKAGYHCIRLDARKCENVIQQKEIYRGLITYEGFKRLEEKGGADFDTFGKGIYPTEIATFGIVDPILLDRQVGTYIWQRPPTPLSTLDMAEEGRDLAFYAAGKYGPAIAFMNALGETIHYQRPRWCLQVEQLFPLQKKNTILMGKDDIEMCQLLHVRPEWHGLDASNTVTLRDWLRLTWGPVEGFKWGGEATEIPILREIREKPNELFRNLKTEMWFATAAWVEFGYIAFLPSIDRADLWAQLTGMRYRRITKVLKQVEDTKDYKKRFGGISPDQASAVVMMQQVVRLRTQQVNRPAMEPALASQDVGETYEDAKDHVFEESYETSDPVKWL